MYSFCKNNAFTLLELLITIAIISIITFVALPHFHTLRENQEVSQLLTMIRQNINLSKNLAKTYHSQIVICSSSSLTQCENNQWHKAMIIYSDLNQNKILDSNEPIHKIFETNIKYGSFVWKGGATNPNTLTFKSDSGLPRGSEGGFHYCSFNHAENHRYIVLGAMGHARIETPHKCN